MAKLVVSQFMTLDGVVEDPGGAEDFERGGWAFNFDRGAEGDKFNAMPKYVVSTTLRDPEWNNSTVIDSDVAGAVSKLKQELQGDILVNGSVQLVGTLVDQGLVDEYRLMVFPTLLGAGKRLFGDTSVAASVRLVHAQPAGETVILTFAAAANGGEG